jgi:hypothetical protein
LPNFLFEPNFEGKNNARRKAFLFLAEKRKKGKKEINYSTKF